MIMTLALAWATIGTNNSGIMAIAIITAPLDFICWCVAIAVIGDVLKRSRS